MRVARYAGTKISKSSTLARRNMNVSLRRNKVAWRACCHSAYALIEKDKSKPATQN